MNETMRGYTTDYVNLIADNLRDRYESGFPILKELIQNADDAKARTFIFGTHPGFPVASNPLLKGSGLWCFNDGKFEESDEEALRSFGINSKAGDASTIGKFGLGMKSVFHLCEAMFYVAFNGIEFRREGLTPWKQGDRMPHPEWDETSGADWQHLTKLGESMVTEGASSWFLLWIPLRSRRHLKTESGRESGAIMSRFPGDDSSRDLAFLHDANLARYVAEILPLLRHLERVEHRGSDNCFELQLDGQPRLMGEPHRERTHGRILVEGGCPLLGYSGTRREDSDSDGFFAKLKRREEWPRTRVRDEWGHEKEEADEAIPEAAVVFCSGAGGRNAQVPSRLQWAVFLPLGNGSEELRICSGERALSITLHGQFFLDSGRKTIHGLEYLPKGPEEPGEGSIDENRLRRVWNQHLVQDVLLPLVLPALEDHIRQQDLDDAECSALTDALRASDWFKTFRRHVCRDGDWLRTLQSGDGPLWRVVGGDCRLRLRPVPRPPKSDQERPRNVFPELVACDVVPYDVEAPRLCRSDNEPGEWTEQELERLLSRLHGLFVDGPSMDYLTTFFESCAGRHLSTEHIQSKLLVVIRRGLQSAGFDARRQVAAKASRLLGFLAPKKRLEIAVELPESIHRALWEIGGPVLLIPRNLDPERSGTARADEQTFAAWMDVLDGALDSTTSDDEQSRILGAAQGLLKTLTADARGRFLRANRTLRIVDVQIVEEQDARSTRKKPVSFEFLEQARRAGTLFRLAEGLREAALGVTPWLARAMPDAEICLIRAQIYRDLFPGDDGQGEGPHIPAAGDGQACLAAVGRLSEGSLGGIDDRRKLLDRTNDPGQDADARRGLRLLLHGALEHRTENQAKLWLGGHNQHPAWNRLWDVMHGDTQWSRIPDELADVVPRSRWTKARITEIDPRTLLDDLARTRQDIEAPEEFSQEEREEILSHIDNESLWLRLPLHTTLDHELVSADGEVYLASDATCSEDPIAREVILIASSQNPDVADQQKRWLRSWDDRARMEIALGAENPSRYWRSVMDALHNLLDPLSDDIGESFRSKAWLPTTCSPPVKPEDVIDLTGSLGDGTHRLVARHRSAHAPCFAVPDDIDAEVRDHRAWERVRAEGFSNALAGLERLELLLEDLSDYEIGTWQRQPDADEVELLSCCESLPGWRLLKTAAAETFDIETAWNHLQPALSKEIEADRLVTVLNWLSEDSGQWGLRKAIHDVYLHQLAHGHRAARERLHDLRLASADGRWRTPAELCAGVHGVVHAALFDTTQADILGDLVFKEGVRSEQADSSGDRPDNGLTKVLEAASTRLRDFFDRWDSSLVPRPMIGVLLGLLGRDMRELTEDYLQPHSFYLSDGEYGDRIADRVRERSWLANALDDSRLMSRFTEEQADKLRRRLVSEMQLKQALVTSDSVWQGTDTDTFHVDLATALERIHQWWSKSRQWRAEEYRNRLFPKDLDLVWDSETGRFDRSSWLMLFALGSFQGMGRPNDEQHRDFIRLCQARGWWDVFADSDPREEPERWMDIIEQYAEAQHDDEEWAQWIAQFPKLYRLRRWMDDYVECFLSMNRYSNKFGLNTILAPRSTPDLQGGGIDPPPLTRTLRVGSHLVVRELLHHGVVSNPLAVHHAYAPIERIRNFFRGFRVTVSTSEEIHKILEEHLGEGGATFCGDYDIPLRIISSDKSLKRELFGESKLEVRFIKALRRIDVDGTSVAVEEDLGGHTPKFRITAAGIKYVMEPQQELVEAEGIGISCRPDFVIRSVHVSGGPAGQPPIAVFMDGFEYHRERTDDDATKRMALKRAGYLVWSLTWYDLDAAWGDGDDATDLLGEDDGRNELQQRNLDAHWNTGRVRSCLDEPSLMLLVRYLHNPGRTQWKRAVFTELLRLIQPDQSPSETLRNNLVRIKRQLPSAIQEALDDLVETTALGGRGRWCGTPPCFADLVLALPIDALEHPDPNKLTVILHLNDLDSQQEGYRQEWNGVLRLFNLLQFLPDARWSTAKGADR